MRISANRFLYFGILIGMVMVLSLFWLAASQLKEMHQITNRLYNHPFIVANNVRNVRTDTRELWEITTKSVYQNETPSDALAQMKKIQSKIDAELQIIAAQFLGNPNDVEAIRATLLELEAQMHQAVLLMLDNKSTEAKDYLHSHHTEALYHQVSDEVNVVVKFASHKANELKQLTLTKLEDDIIFFGTLTLIILLSGIMISIKTIRYARREFETMNIMISNIKSEVYLPIEINSNDIEEFYNLKSTINRMISTITSSKEKILLERQRYKKIMDYSSDAIYIMDLDGKLVEFSKQTQKILGYTNEEMQKLSVYDWEAGMSAKEIPGALAAANEDPRIFETKHKRKDGSVYDAEITAILIEIEGIKYIYASTRDISERKQYEKKLESLSLRKDLALSVGTVGIWEWNYDSNSLVWDDLMYQIYGIEKENKENPYIMWSNAIDSNDKSYVEENLFNAKVTNGEYNTYFWITTPSGEKRYIHAIGKNELDNNSKAFRMVGINIDITKEKNQAVKLEYIAHYDPLTGLPNRILNADRLRQAMIQAQRRDEKIAVLYLDLDGFKEVNDRYGHSVGDKLLIALALEMKQALRAGDTLSRLGGDEFVAILVDMNNTSIASSIIQRLLSATSQAIQVDDIIVQVSASIGVTFYPQHEDVDADQLIRQADQAMYEAKQSGKNRYHIFDSDNDRTIRTRHENLERIQQALNNNELVLYYQPKINMRTGSLIGAEALIRWQHPEKGLIPPLEFLPIIENHPLSVEIGEWVINEAISQIERWQEQGLNLTVSVNVGARQLLQGDFVERLQFILTKHEKFDSSLLEIEALETSALEDINHASQIIEECKTMGVLFALDDFGTGYSSLTYLKQLPVKTLKIDQSFVRDMLEDRDDLVILEGIIGLAKAFNHEVIAEGVETSEHGKQLLLLGCELAQGYGIARPMPPEKLIEWSKGWERV